MSAFDTAASGRGRYIVVTFLLAFALFAVFSFLTDRLIALSLDDGSLESTSWNLKVMEAKQLQGYSTGEGETIAFLDTGINSELAEHHADRISAKRNVVDGTDDVADDNGHGTEMVSIACGDGYMGVYGLAPEAKIIVVKVTDDNGSTDNEKMLASLK